MDKLRQECTLAAELLRKSLGHMEDLMEVAEMEESPDHAVKMVSAEADIATHACDKLKELMREYEHTKTACPATLTHMTGAIKEYEEMEEEYRQFKEENGGNPY